MDKKYYIPVIEVDLTNRCNLNCARCTHLSPLAQYNIMDYSLDVFEKDIKELSNKFIVGILRIVGGEPFLLPNLEDYLRVAKENFSYSAIEIFSNGILKDKIKELSLKLNQYKIKTIVSKYKDHTQASSSDVSLVKNKETFRCIAISLTPDYDARKSKIRCASKEDISMYNGRLYHCPIMKNLESLEKAFNIDFKLSLEDRSVDLYAPAEEVFLALHDESRWGKLCSHCPSSWRKYQWELSKKDIIEWVEIKDK